MNTKTITFSLIGILVLVGVVVLTQKAVPDRKHEESTEPQNTQNTVDTSSQVEWLQKSETGRKIYDYLFCEDICSDEFAEIEEKKPEVVPILIQLINGDNYKFQLTRVISTLGKMNEVSAVEPLTKYLKNEDAVVRYTTVVALGKLGDVSVAGDLIPLLNNDDQTVREKTAIVLGGFHSQEALIPLRQAFEKEKVQFVRKAMEEAIAEIEKVQ